MKKYLLPQNGTFYKANLHCHSTVSDGEYSPEELKERYMAQGYSVIAYTDHHVMVPHSELTDENFVALIGWEMGFGEPDPEALARYGAENPAAQKYYARNCDICAIAPAPDALEQPCYHRTKYVSGFMQPSRALVTYDESLPDFERTMDPECINEAIRRHVDKGFFVTYNHPGFSLANYTQYSQYRGMQAMEICNFSSIATGSPDYNEKEYDDFLRLGQRLYCIATDDNHNHERSRLGWPSDSFGAFTMIKAEKLEYTALVEALKAGNMYASQGPLIHGLWVEDGKLHVSCSEAEQIRMNTASRRCGVLESKDGVPLTEAVFDIIPEDGYVRVTITDSRGKCANSNAYFVEDIL